MVADLRSFVPDWLFRTLQRAGLRVESGATASSLMICLEGSRPMRFDVLRFPVLSLERAQQIVEGTRSRPEERVLLAIRQLSDRTREMLRAAGCSWAEELTGIVHVVGPGLFVNVNREPQSGARRESGARVRLRGRSGLLAEALLTSPAQERIDLRTLAGRAHASSALASRVLNRLSQINLVEVHGAGPNKSWLLADRGGLLDLWGAEEHPRPEKSYGIYVWSRTSQGLLEKLPALDHLTDAWALGGAAAANSYAPTLTTYPDPTIWIDARIPPEDVARVLGGDLAEKGANMQLWQSERNLALELATLTIKGRSSVPGIRLVSKPRAYIETFRAAGRLAEIAHNLRGRILSSNDSDGAN